MIQRKLCGWWSHVAVFAVVTLQCVGVRGDVEALRLTEDNWQAACPQGKEVDAIVGDFVVRNERLVAVIAAARPERHANLTIRRVGGSLLDLTERRFPNDQLGAYFPAPTRSLTFQELRVDGGAVSLDEGEARGQEVELIFGAAADEATTQPELRIVYRLGVGDSGLKIATKVVGVPLSDYLATNLDALRADGEMELGGDDELAMVWARDRYWQQAYGIAVEDGAVTLDAESVAKKRPMLRFNVSSDAVGELVRTIYPATNDVQVRAKLLQSRGAGAQPFVVQIRDPQGQVEGAQFEVKRNGRPWGGGRAGIDGSVQLDLPEGDYEIRASHYARGEASAQVAVSRDDVNPSSRRNLAIQPEKVELLLAAAGYAAFEVAEQGGGAIPCKIEFAARDEAKQPNFGPDSAVHGVRNLIYTANGKHRVPLAPGEYDVVVSHGPEYDAVKLEVRVEAGKTQMFPVALRRSVDTSGWISAEYHSHSSPSGDNTASQRGRVLNLLAEHLEFAPCTEHARIATYDEHLRYFGAENAMATCPGMELTGSPLPINHQNAFPLEHAVHHQNGGGPETDANPEVQIERLALWDDASDKLVQVNHPNIPQMLGDRDLDGAADEGFRKMFGWMDVIEV
ncbi:MAG: hypothetical protein KDA61_07360, partial [Planctomycetales bacterium]|nr:hypothetical protein [Planctomycetales bacterium]